MYTLYVTYYFPYIRKKKNYDGSASLKMIGNDCKTIEDNIDTFLSTFIEDKNSTWEAEQSLKLRQILSLYKSFKDLGLALDVIILFRNARCVLVKNEEFWKGIKSR